MSLRDRLEVMFHGIMIHFTPRFSRRSFPQNSPSGDPIDIVMIYTTPRRWSRRPESKQAGSWSVRSLGPRIMATGVQDRITGEMFKTIPTLTEVTEEWD